MPGTPRPDETAATSASATSAPAGPTGTRGRSRPNPLVLAPIALAILAEAAWTAVLAGLLQAFALRPPTLGIPGTLLACVAGLAAARWLAPRAGDRWPTVAAALTIGIAALGWLASPESRSILADRGIDALGAAIIANLGGFVAGVAFLRGMPYARLPPDPQPIATALAVGTPGIAIAAIVGGMVGDPWRSQFLGETTTEVIVFLVAGIASLTLSRLTLVGSGAGAGSVDWRRNPAWIGLAALLLAGIATTALATSAIAGPAIVAVLGAAIPSLLVLGFVAGFDRRSLRIVAISLAIALFLGQVLRIIGPRAAPPVALPPLAPTPPPDPAVATPLTIVMVAIAVALAAIAIVVLITLWMRRPRVADDDPDEERWIDHGDVGGRDVVKRRRRASRLGRGRPADAVAAYRMLIEVLASRPAVRREEGETPAEHAARLREGGRGALGLDLLAADYGLVRFGGIRLTEAEERRAIGRAGVLRRMLLGDAAQAGGGSGPGAAAKPGEDTAPEGGPGTRSRYRVG
jgi:hypothetical protein